MRWEGLELEPAAPDCCWWGGSCAPPAVAPSTACRLPIIPLHARQPELLGVYWRPLRRRTADADPPLPPDDVLNEWVLNLWRRAPDGPGHHLRSIAFSAAVVRRLPRLLQRDWTLIA